VAGFNVTTQPQEVRKSLGLAMQTPTLDVFSTGRETLELSGRLHRMPGPERRARADELLELMNLTSVARKLTGTYSGGMKRRLDLAAALMHRPKALILDEPTEGR
jgi:ABC-type multidrug transport system ATPase subunit